MAGHIEQYQPDSAASEIFGEGDQQLVVKPLLARLVVGRFALNDVRFPVCIGVVSDQVISGTLLQDRAAEPVLQAAQSTAHRAVTMEMKAAVLDCRHHLVKIIVWIVRRKLQNHDRRLEQKPELVKGADLMGQAEAWNAEIDDACFSSELLREH